MPSFAIQMPGRRLLCSTAVGLVFSLAAAEDSRAACAPGATGGDDTIVCTGINAGNLSAGGGNDRVTVADDGEVHGNLTGASGNDSLWVSFGTVTGSVGGGSGSDTLVIGAGSGAAAVSIDISAGDLSDVIYLGTGAEVGGRLLGGSGDDVLIFAAGTVGLDILGGAGNDQVTLAGGSAAEDVLGGSGDDIFTLAGSHITGALYGGSGGDAVRVTAGTASDIYGGQGDDEVTLSGGVILADIYGSSGGDGITLLGGLLGNDAYGGSGADDITLDGSSVTGDLFGGSGDDRFSIVSGSADEVRGSEGGDTLAMTGGSVNRLDGGDHADTVTVSGGTVASSVTGGSGSDRLFVGGSATVGAVDGGADADLIAITGTATVTGALLGRAGDDTFHIGGTAIVAEVGGGSGADTFELVGGSVGSDVYGGSGADAFTLAGSSVTGDLLGGSGIDDFSIMAGTADEVLGGSGEDQLMLLGGTVDRLGGGQGNDWMTIILGTADEVLGEGGDDNITMSGGTVNYLDGGQDDDSLRIIGGSVDAQVSGGGGDDLIQLYFMAIAQDVGGGSGNDIIYVADLARVKGSVTGASGADQFSLYGELSRIDGDVNGGSGNDYFYLEGTSVAGDLRGDVGNDTFEIDGTASIAGDILGGSGADTIGLFNATDLAGIVSGGDNDDYIEIRGAHALGNVDGALLFGIDTLDGGAGSDDLIQFTGVTGQLPAGFEGFEWIVLAVDTTLDIHDGSNDTRAITATGLGIFSQSVLVADGNSPGVFDFTGNMGVAGTLEMRDGEADDRVNVSGDFANGAGVLGIDAALDATALADRLTIGGSVADVQVLNALFQAGSMAVEVNDIGGAQGALTGDGPGNGIVVIDVSATGNTDAGDFFLLGGPIQKGAVEYDLSLESDGIWYLQSSFLAQVFGYAATPSAAVAMGQEYLASLRERVGTREQSWTGGAVQSSEGTGVWLRGGGSFGQVEDGNGFDYDQDHWFAQAGADFPLLLDPNGPRLVGGLFAHYGTSDITSKDETGADAAKGTLDAWGGGLSLTWYGSAEGAAGLGLYADLVGQVSVYDAEVKADGATGSTDGWGFGVSLEAGWGFEIGRNLRLIPQAQLSYSRVDLDDFTDSDGVDVEYGVADSLEGRVGFAVDSGKLWRSGNVTFDANLVHEFLGESEAEAGGLDIGTDLEGTAAEIGLGGTVSLLDNVSLYADVDYRIPLDEGREAVSANLGVRISW